MAIGDVVGSTPGYEAFVNSGDQVSLTTSTGYCKVQVPSVIGELQSQAMATLGAAHLSVSVSPTDPSTCSPSQIGFVTDQSLAPSTFVPFNSMITISVCDASTIPPTTTTTL